MTGTGKQRRLEIKDLGVVKGAVASVAFALRPNYEQCRAYGLSSENHRFVAAGALVPEAGRSKHAVAQNVKRCRDEVAEAYEAIHGRPPPKNLVIQNRRNHGYRLNPEMRLIVPDGDTARGNR